jgi:hypothetical protein
MSHGQTENVHIQIHYTIVHHWSLEHWRHSDTTVTATASVAVLLIWLLLAFHCSVTLGSFSVTKSIQYLSRYVSYEWEFCLLRYIDWTCFNYHVLDMLEITTNSMILLHIKWWTARTAPLIYTKTSHQYSSHLLHTISRYRRLWITLTVIYLSSTYRQRTQTY